MARWYGGDMTAEGFGALKIGQIAVPVHDLAKAVEFYRDVLHMRLLFEAPPNMAFFDCDGVRVMLAVPEGDAAHTMIVYYTVRDIQEAVRVLKGRGARFEREPHLVAKLADGDLWMAFLRDVDRNLLALMSQVVAAA